MNKVYILPLLGILLVCSCLQNTGNKAPQVRNELISKDFVALDQYVKDASPKEKYELWTIKLADAINNAGLSEEEQAAIKPMYELLSVESFTPGTPECETLRACTEDLEKRLIEEYNWDEKKLFHTLSLVLTEAEIVSYNNKWGTDF